MSPLFIIVVIVLALLAVWVVRTAGWRFATLRFSQAFLIVVLVTFGTTWLLRLVPGDACITVLGTSATEEGVAACREDRKLDENIVVQYLDWGGKVTGINSDDGFLQPDLGFAYYKQGIPLTEILGKRAPRTGWLFLYSQLTALFISVPIGIWSAYQAGRRPRKWMYGVAALPVGLFVAWVLAYKWPGEADDGLAGIAEGPVTAALMLVLIPLFAWMFSRRRTIGGYDLQLLGVRGAFRPGLCDRRELCATGSR